MKTPFSKRLLKLDYIIMGILLLILIAGAIINGIYVMYMSKELLSIGMDASMISQPFDLSILATIVSVWAAQLGISSGAYYVMVKSDHKIEYPLEFIEKMPEDIKAQVDMTSIITAVLSITGD